MINKKAFTLIELIVVIAIIGVLAALTIGSYSRVQKNARDTRRKADLNAMKTALAVYYSEKNEYPSTADAWWGVCSTYGSKSDTGSTGYIPDLAPDYIDVLPRDPTESRNASGRCYLYRSNKISYKILAHQTQEGDVPTSKDSFFDPHRSTQHTLQVSSDSVVRTTW